MSFAIDANVLLLAANESAPEQTVAKRFLDRCASGPELVCVSWTTLLAYLRIATHPSIFPSPQSQRAAEENVGALLSLPHVRVLQELEGFWEVYRELTGDVPVRGNLVMDAHLAAVLKQNGIRTIYTRDADFRRFGFLEVRDPLKG